MPITRGSGAHYRGLRFPVRGIRCPLYGGQVPTIGGSGSHYRGVRCPFWDDGLSGLTSTGHQVDILRLRFRHDPITSANESVARQNRPCAGPGSLGFQGFTV